MEDGTDPTTEPRSDRGADSGRVLDPSREQERIRRLIWPDGPAPPPIAISPVSTPVPSAFPVADIAGITVASATAAAFGFGMARGAEVAPASIDTDHALADWRAFALVDGEGFPTWAPLSGRYRSVTGRWIQLHCNFAHHAAGVAERLGVEQDRAAFEAAIAEADPFELEDVLRRDGMICAAYRTIDEWDRHPHAAATADLPLIDVDRLGPAEPGPMPTARSRPLDGVRVVDCSRVLAGPVCGRTLAAHGASVLRVGAAHLPSIPLCVAATGFGKRNAELDLRSPEDRERFAALLGEADVFVDAYRPGALAALGFSAERVAEIRPGIVVVELNAFDRVGPWADRRGYDSIVQSTTGVAMAQAELLGRDEPVHLPVQALDFATGYLAAAAAAGLLHRQRSSGGSWRARLSLLRTRNWLVGLDQPRPFTEREPADIDRFLHRVDSPMGVVTAVRPVVGEWRLPPSPLGSHPAIWPDA